MRPLLADLRLPPPAPARPAAVVPLVGVLRQLKSLLDAMTDDQYAQKPVGVVPSSVGGHVRHCLDHLDALLDGLDSGSFSYDARARGTPIETNRRAALAALRRLERRLLDGRFPAGSRPLRLRAIVAPDRPAVEATTTLDRELAFVLSHTIHHNALVGVMAVLLGVAPPATFGYAPSTLAHKEATT